MEFDELLSQVLALLQREERVSYRSIKLRFGIDDDYIEGLKDELIYAKKLAADEDNRVLVWTGDTDTTPTASPTSLVSKPAASQMTETEHEPLSYTPAYLAEKILTSRSALEGERKQVTVLFCDLQNSTPLAEKIGPENMHALLNRFFELALNEVHRYEGTINQFLGDGFMALFGAPISHEDHARRAVLAAIGLQRTLKEAVLGKPYGIKCRFRIGINSGLVVVGSIGDNLRMDYSAIGDTTNLAARLQTQSEPGTILVSDSTSRLVEDYIRLEPLEPVEVKGKAEPVSIYKVMGTLPRRSPIVSRSERTLSQFVGRERELATLEELFTQVESGNGQVVSIVAEAGQGKSRLLYEFRQRLQEKRVTYLEGRCLSYGSSIPYHPIIDVLRNNCGIGETDKPEAIIKTVGVALREVGMDSEESAPYLLRLLGVQEGTESISMLTPEAVRTRTFETLREMSLKGSQRQPLIVEIEDTHWCDNTSEAYLSSLVESLPGASLLLLTSYRPGYCPPWLEKSYATQISLQSLAPQHALAVVHSTSRDRQFPEYLEQEILSKAEGNPFFLEELTRVIIEHGDLQTGMLVPDTIQGVLSARIDRLPETHKRLLQTASVLGREFSPRLLREIWEGSGSLDVLLSELKRLEFLFERTGAEEGLYVFRHALTENVAYDSLLITRRQALHAAAGQALETLYADRLEDAYDRLAYHYSNGDMASKAVEYLRLAAEKSAQGHAHSEAAAMLQEARVHAALLPEEERERCALDIIIRQAESLFYIGRRQEIVDDFIRYKERLEELQEPLFIGSYYTWVGFAYAFLGNREQAQNTLQRALEAGEQCGDAVIMGMAHCLLAQEMNFSGALQQGIQHGKEAISLFEGTKEQYWLGQSLYVLGLLYSVFGESHRAIEVSTRVHAIGEIIGDCRLQTNALYTIGVNYTWQGGWETGIEALRYAQEISPDAFESALILGSLGYAYLEQNRVKEAVVILEQAVEAADRYRSRQVQSWFRSYLGEAYGADGQVDKAYDYANQGLERAKDIRIPWWIGLAQRALGRIAHTSNNLSDAETYLQEALTTFKNIQARYELARTRLDLASLAHTQGNPDTATMHLSTAYAWFQKLQVPQWVERTEQLARKYGMTFAEVELDDLTEGSS
jgi:class 3 adenylate cyclase/tetratricopeptide (TPR) repeat protein